MAVTGKHSAPLHDPLFVGASSGYVIGVSVMLLTAVAIREPKAALTIALSMYLGYHVGTALRKLSTDIQFSAIANAEGSPDA